MPRKSQAQASTVTSRRPPSEPLRAAPVEVVPAEKPRLVQTRVRLDQDFCLILADFGADGRAFLGTDEGDATFARAVRDIVERDVEDVVAVLQFNPVTGHARDVTQDVARAVSERVLHDGDYPHESLRHFLDAYGLGYPPSLEARVFQHSQPPEQGERQVASSPSARARRAPKAPKKRSATSAKGKAGKSSKASRGAKPKGRASPSRK
jgi:hypothetical protein